MTAPDLDRLLKAYASQNPEQPCRITPELVMLKADLASADFRRARARNLERMGFILAGALLMIGIALAPNLPGVTILGGVTLLGALGGLGAFAWSLE